MKSKRDSFTRFGLLMTLWFLVVAAVGLTVAGVVIWAIIKLVSHFT